MLHFLLVPALLAPTPASGAGTTFYLSGNQILNYCTSNIPAEYTMCLGFLEGISDQFALARSVNNLPQCVPTGVTGDQLKDVVVGYLRANPAHREYAAARQVVEAYIQTWCPAT